ncbi:MAG: phosphoglycerate dehydrogenase [Bdellovibrionaceae bacterium]|nr:phosphoglycerate dehydrogenase [Pseudobdellovibrionaceae bacterium]
MTKLKVLLLEAVHPQVQVALEEAGFAVTYENRAWTEEELIKNAKDFSVIGLRSKTKLHKSTLEKLPQLLAVGAFCIGTDQVNLSAAGKLGIPVFNAPYGSTRSVAELVLCEMIALSRRLCDLNQATHSGVWAKSTTGMQELRSKVLGIVGYGHIGSQVSILAEFFGMKVLYYDVKKTLALGNATAVSSLKSVLQQSDFVSLHVPNTEVTNNLITKQELSLMKKSAFLINASRGSVVNLEDLKEALTAKNLAGAAIDVYPVEPKKKGDAFNTALQNLENVILTPHIGGSTLEAQEAIGTEVSQSLIDFIARGDTSNAVNVPAVSLPKNIRPDFRDLIHFHENKPGVLGEVNKIISSYNINVKAQSLSTNDEVGCLLMRIDYLDQDIFEKVLEKIQDLKPSISTRSL